MGYYLTEHLVHDIADEPATSVNALIDAGLALTVVVSDLSYRADWNSDKMTENAAGKSPLVLLERTYGDADMNRQAETEEMAETALLMMDREGVSLDTLLNNLPQNIEAGDLFPSSEAVGLVAGHLAIAVAGLDRETNSQIMFGFQGRILEAIARELSADDDASDSYYVGTGTDDDEPRA